MIMIDTLSANCLTQNAPAPATAAVAAPHEPPRHAPGCRALAPAECSLDRPRTAKKCRAEPEMSSLLSQLVKL